MVDKSTNDDYIRLYKELVDRINDKEDIIERMTEYIAKYARKTENICINCKAGRCNTKRCKESIRNYFEEEKWIN